jgi:hypothetical protein
MPLTMMPQASPAAAVTTERMTGPTPEPASASSRQMPRKVGRPIAGEVSAARVMTMPEPMPLPKPMIIAVNARVRASWVRGMRTKEMPMMITQGTATQRRP